jgi:hypothetical protein
MGPLCYRRHRFPPEIIQHAIWLYLRFTLSYRDVEELLAERGLDISYETVRRWVLKFGPAIARRLRQRRPRPGDRWHLDEMVVRISGERMYLWRAVDHEVEVLDMLVQRRRDTRAALRLMRKLLKKQGFVPKLLVTPEVQERAAVDPIGAVEDSDLAADNEPDDIDLSEESALSGSCPARCRGREGEEVRFASDSPVEEARFEPSVPLWLGPSRGRKRRCQVRSG